MRAIPLRLSLALLLAGLAASARAQDADVMALVRADRWADAEAAVAALPDPAARKLVTYYRMLAPGAATATEIGQFIADSPDWPRQASLAERRDAALATEPDDTLAAAQCDAGAATSASALGRCAEALSSLGRTADATADARRAWVALPPDGPREAVFLTRWGAVLTPADQWRRFEHLAWSDTAGATRQLPRLAPADSPRAAAWLALRRDDVSALALVEALPGRDRDEPGLALEQARYLRRAGLDPEALKFWNDSGFRAEARAAPDHLSAFWDERNILARHRLRDGDAAGAYALAADASQTAPEQVADANFLAGFIALRKRDDRTAARRHFQVLAEISKAAITQGRAHFWLARAAADEASAKREYQAAAAWPNTFYGQLAALALNEGPAGLAARITAQHDPGWTREGALAFTGREVARAAAYLVSWGEPRRAASFLLRLTDIAPEPDDLAMAARLAGGFAMPETEIAIARRAGRAGVILLESGWPLAAEVPRGAGVEPALVLGIIRQESSFDTTTVSPVGASGLMQLMPATAAQTARAIGLRLPLPSLTADTAVNIQLGAAYLRAVLDQFDNCAPLAIAAYNAGPGRVNEWLGSYGDPRGDGVEMLDWLEEIPFSETRNYVQRVIENEVIYRARRGDAAPHPLAQWLR
jgi:soluble lytic murein transglycosylase